MALLEIKNIETLYGLIFALRGVSLQIEEGNIYTLLGANGAGKSTLLKTTMGLIEDQPDKGTIWYDGRRIDGKDTEDIVRRGIAYVPEGREVFEGIEVVKIEYYPTNVFGDDEPREGEKQDEDEDFDEEAFEHMFDKTSLVTMLVLPEEHQVVKWTFENVGFEFLPYRWLVRMDELRASMIMHQPIEGIWLPREIRAAASASTASFDLNVEFSREFFDYKETAVGAGVVFGRPKR